MPLPEDPLVCLCMSVTKPEISTAIQQFGLQTVKEIGLHSAAGTACGRCRPKLQAILEEEANPAASAGGQGMDQFPR